MNKRVFAYQLVIFVTQWGLMILGFGILSKVVAPIRLFGSSFTFGTYVDAGVKALIALALSVVWLYLWDRQVRFYFYKQRV